MKILVVGYDTPGALERYCVGALRKEGHDTAYFDAQVEFARHLRFQGVPVVSEIEQTIWRGRYNRRLVERIRHEEHDLVLVFKGIELNADTLAKIRTLSKRPLLVNWNPDSPFDTTASNSSRELVASIPYYDVYFIWDRDLFEPLREAGSAHAEYLPFAHDPAVHHLVELSGSDVEKYSSDICFVGGYTPKRQALLERLTDFDLKIWGPNWQWLPASSPLKSCLQGGWTHGEEMSKVFSGAKIVLNFIRKQNGQAHNMRTFEAPAAGSMMLTTRTRDQLAWLAEDEGAVYFADSEELLEKAAYYLEHDEERRQIAKTGYKLITSGGYTYDDRMRELISVVEGL